MTGRGFLQKTLIRVGFSQPGERILANVVRRGPEMLSEWGGCDGASGRKQQQERAQHACIRLWGSAGWSQHSRAVWVPISAQL